MNDCTLILLIAIFFFYYLIFLRGSFKTPVRIRIYNATRMCEVISQGVAVYPFFRRATGLLNHISLGRGEGIYLYPVFRVHTQGMHFPIDILFIDHRGRVVKTFENVPPNAKNVYSGGRWRMGAIEVPAGTCQRTGTTVNDQVRIESVC